MLLQLPGTPPVGSELRNIAIFLLGISAPPSDGVF